MTTKDKLIHSAIKLFSEKGFEATSTTAICKDAGFSSWALFVHFKTKNDLLDFIYLDIKREYFEAANCSLEDKEDIIDIMETAMLQGAQYYLKNPDRFIFIKRFINSPHLSRLAQEEVDKELAPMYNLLNTGKAQGIINDLPNDLIFGLITGAYYGLIEYAIMQNTIIWKWEIEAILKIIKKD